MKIASILGLGVTTLALHAAAAWPERPIKVVVPFAPGGAADAAVRVIAPRMELAKPIVVENQAGAGGTIGTTAVARAAPDGYTFLVGSAANAIGGALVKDLPYDFSRDLIAVAMLADVPGVLVVAKDVPVKTVPEFVAYVKARPGKVAYGSPGLGTSVHMAGELFSHTTKTEMLHVPYKGASAALTDLLAGRIQVMFPALAAVQGQVKDGRLRALAVTTAQRTPLAPELPTVAEAGVPGYEVGGWIGIFAPKGTPEAVLNAFRAALAKALADPGVAASLTKVGVEPRPMEAEKFKALVAAETARWAKLVREAKITAE